MIPSWAGPNAPTAQNRVIQFLEGTNDRAGGCFTPTKLASVDYSGADLSEHLNGVIATYRYRRMAEEMRERYTLVLMMAPDLEYLGDEEDYLSTMAEGVVLILDEHTNPTEVEGYIHNLRMHGRIRLRGSFDEQVIGFIQTYLKPSIVAQSIYLGNTRVEQGLLVNNVSGGPNPIPKAEGEQEVALLYQNFGSLPRKTLPMPKSRLQCI